MLMLFFILLGSIVVTTLLFLVMIGSSYEVVRTRVIDQDIATVFDKLKDLKSWPEWSPWLFHEPDAKLSFSDNCDQEGGSYSWDGERIGEGRLTHLSLEDPTRIVQRLDVVRPMKSVSDLSIVLTTQKGKTHVTWTMKGSVPFFLRFAKRKIVASITQDFDLGLLKLARLFDPQFESPIIDFHGIVELSPVHCLSKRFVGGPQKMAEATRKEFPKLIKHVKNQKGTNGRPMTLYRKYNLSNLNVDCVFAVPAKTDMDDYGNYKSDRFGGGDYLKVTLKGGYQFLGLAWYSAFSHLRMSGITMDYTRPRMEVYENDVKKIENTNEWETTLYLPVKR